MNGMDSDSSIDVRIAGQPTLELGTRFTFGNTSKFTGARRTFAGSDSGRRARGYRESSASHRLPVGQGHPR